MAVDVGSIVAHMVLDRTQFTAGLAAAREEGRAFGDVTSHLTLDKSRFDEGVAQALAEKARLGDPEDIPVNFDLAEAEGEAAALEALKAAVADPISIPVGVRLTDYLRDAAGYSALGALGGDGGGGGGTPIALGAGGSGGGGSNHIIYDFYYHSDPNSGGGGGGGAGGILSSLLWGGGSGLPFLGGLAGLGSIASFAGLGPEHVIMTLLGLAGSAAGGAIGGGLLGAGILGTTAVGAGTDLAGIGQAAGDIKTVNTDLNSLNQAIALYGKNSTQAAAAQAQLNYDLNSFSPLAKAAVLAAAEAAQGFVKMFDNATGAAESVGAQIITQLITTAEKFLPTIGSFALQNMEIIKQDIQPFLSWLTSLGTGGGLTIFQDLEQRFTTQLPTAIHAATQGFELFAKTIDLAASYTGSLLPKIDAFLTRMNGAEWSVWSGEVVKFIDDFRLWEGLVKALVVDIYELFHNDAGTAGSIVSYLTEMLNKLGEWEKSTSGADQLHNIFEVHKQEILELLQLLPPLLTSFGHIYLTVAPALTHAFTVVLEALAPLLDAMAKNPVGAWVLGLGLIAARLGILVPAIQGLAGLSVFGDLVTYVRVLASEAWDSIINGLRGIGVSLGIIDAEADANPVGAIILGIVVLGAAIYELYEHWNTIWRDVWGVLKQYSWEIAAGLTLLSGFVLLPVAAVLLLATHWHEVMTDLKNWTADAVSFLDGSWQTVDRDARNWFGDMESFIERMWSDTYNAVKTTVTDIYNFLDGVWQRSDTDARNWWGDIESFFERVWGDIYRGIQSTANDIYNFLDGIWHRMDADVRNWWGDIENFLKGIFGAIISAVTSFGNTVYNVLDGIWHRVDTDVRNWWGDVQKFLASMFGTIEGVVTAFGNKIYSFLDGIWHSVDSDARKVWADIESFFKGIPGTIIGFFASLPGQFLQMGQEVIQQLWQGIKAAIQSLGSSFSSAGSSIAGSIVGGIISGITGGAGGILHALTSATSGGQQAVLTGVSTGGGSDAANQALGQQLAAQAGWSGSEWSAFNQVVMDESGWNSTAQNPNSTAYGIAQNIGGLAGYGPGGNSPAVQIQWMINYIRQRYGDPIAALAHENAVHWYAGGTNSAAGGLAVVGENGPELVSLPRGAKVFSNAQSSGLGGGITLTDNRSVSISVGSGVNAPDVQRAVQQALDQDRRHLVAMLEQHVGVGQ